MQACGSREQVDHFCIASDCIEQERSMANGRIAFEAQEGGGFFTRELKHLSRLNNRLRQFQLAGIDALKVGLSTGPRCCPAVGRRSERFEMEIFDPCLLKR